MNNLNNQKARAPGSLFLSKTTPTTVHAGYWGGVDRHLSNKGHVLIHDTLAPIKCLAIWITGDKLYRSQKHIDFIQLSSTSSNK